MILTIPTIYLKNGKSKYSIKGLTELSKLDAHFKNNPFEIAKLFREENSKSILFQCDISFNSLKVIKKVTQNLDIPIQLIINTNPDYDALKSLNILNLNRIFIPIEYVHKIESSIPIIKKSEFNTNKNYPFGRIMIDFESTDLCDVNAKEDVKISVVNSICDTKTLSEFNQLNTQIDSIYLGKEYYGIHFAGQLLWRIAEKQQFSI